ncbi:MAG: hypothetical protein ACUVQK_00660 [Thermogutta sp.]
MFPLNRPRWVLILSVLQACACAAAFARPLLAWGPHPDITRAALRVVPHMQEWEESLGKENIAALTQYCWMPDWRGQDLGVFYADDYLLVRPLPYHVSHVMPAVEAAFEVYFRRALQGLRTETPVNACRQLGTLVHFVEDVGAPPHAKPNCPHHSELENWVDAKQISIEGYQPRLLGNTDDEAWRGLKRRIDGLIAFSAERAERALPLVSSPNPDRTAVEPIILESALESARVTADLLYTVFTLSLRPADTPGAELTGTAVVPPLPGNDDQQVRIVLLNTDYATLATLPDGSGPEERTYRFAFHNLPTGQYQVLAYRPGAQAQVLETSLAFGEPAQLHFHLAPTDPPGNLVYNPDFSLETLKAGQPDRWTKSGVDAWVGTTIALRPGKRYRIGAVFRQVDATVEFLAPPGKRAGEQDAPLLRIVLTPRDGKAAEAVFEAQPGYPQLTVKIVTKDVPGEAVERVWVHEAD